MLRLRACGARASRGADCRAQHREDRRCGGLGLRLHGPGDRRRDGRHGSRLGASGLQRQYRGSTAAASHDYNWHDAIHDAHAGNLCGSDRRRPATTTAMDRDGEPRGRRRRGRQPDRRSARGRASSVAGTWTGHGPRRATRSASSSLAPTDNNGANPRPDLAAHVINNSWGCPALEGCTDPNVLRGDRRERPRGRDRRVVSAGNSGRRARPFPVPPTFYDAAFSVGSTNNTDIIASFSCRGPITATARTVKPDIAAPGVNARVARPRTFHDPPSPEPRLRSAPDGRHRPPLLAAPHFIGNVARRPTWLKRPHRR